MPTHAVTLTVNDAQRVAQGVAKAPIRPLIEARIWEACAHLLAHHSAADRVLRSLDSLRIDVRDSGLVLDAFHTVFLLLGFSDALGPGKFDKIEEALTNELASWIEGRDPPLTEGQAETLVEWLVDTRDSLRLKDEFLDRDPFPPAKIPAQEKTVVDPMHKRAKAASRQGKRRARK